MNTQVCITQASVHVCWRGVLRVRRILILIRVEYNYGSLFVGAVIALTDNYQQLVDNS